MNKDEQVTPLCDEEYCFLPIIYKTNKMCEICPKKTRTNSEVEE